MKPDELNTPIFGYDGGEPEICVGGKCYPLSRLIIDAAFEARRLTLGSDFIDAADRSVQAFRCSSHVIEQP